MRTELLISAGNWRVAALLIVWILPGCGESPPTPGPVVPPPGVNIPAPVEPPPVAAESSDPAAGHPDAGIPAAVESDSTVPASNPPSELNQGAGDPSTSNPEHAAAETVATPDKPMETAPAPSVAETTPATPPSTPGTNVTTSVNPSGQKKDPEGESFALVGKPDGKEYFKLNGREDDLEEVDVTELPDYVDGSMFRVTGGHSGSKLIPSTSNPIQNLPPEVEVLPEFGYSPDGLPYRIRVTTNDPVEMALVPAGEFIRGRNGDAPELSPQQSVYLDSFYMDITEVTVERFMKIKEEMTKSKRIFTPPGNQNQGSPEAAAVGIVHGDARFYAKWAGKELPTEAQWEKAARGTEGGEYPWGNGRPIWNRLRQQDQIDPVGSFPNDVSPYGIFDLAGNAREWCRDNYSPKAYAELGSTPDKLKNPEYVKKASSEAVYVVRGGAPDWSIFTRGSEKGTSRNSLIGFRCVYQLPASKSP